MGSRRGWWILGAVLVLLVVAGWVAARMAIEADVPAVFGGP